MRCNAVRMALMVPLRRMMRSVVPGKNSRLRDSCILAPDWSWNSLIVDPPLPMIDPAEALEIRKRTEEGVSLALSAKNAVKRVVSGRKFLERG
jgi:hypothetical protein